ncbi:L-ascorbate oxidase homolog [Vicia villosa]|uniref:L-ascorbate oxidase homolog n=1 Tax=Vicia villosa TaxID=3911 RepID=UPI00273B0C59|nr:L-ascorbate oxidase homolog [Vicia villosa]
MKFPHKISTFPHCNRETSTRFNQNVTTIMNHLNSFRTLNFQIEKIHRAGFSQATASFISSKDACSAGFEQRTLFTQQVLAKALNQMLVAYRFYTWNVTYGDIYPLRVKQQGILINGQFPGPQIEAVTNDNLIINVFNSSDQPFLFSWNGVEQRRNSWQDGVYGTNCPIPPGKNFTYVLQVKD